MVARASSFPLKSHANLYAISSTHAHVDHTQNQRGLALANFREWTTHLENVQDTDQPQNPVSGVCYPHPIGIESAMQSGSCANP